MPALRRSLSLLVLLLWCATARADLRLEFLDVGQGDACLITSPTGKTVLIDGGPPEGSAHLAARVATLPGKIDLVILTHRHADHLGGLAAALRARGARMMLDSNFVHPTPLYDTLIAEATQLGVEVKNAVAGRRIDIGGGATITLLGPPQPYLTGTRSDVNANSVIARLDYRNMSVLFAADAEADTERWLLAHGAHLAANIVKVPHHGARFSSTPAFVHAVHPQFAIVSVGAHNRYHHPTREALARWTDEGAKVYRTDESGDVTITTDGEHIKLKESRTP